MEKETTLLNIFNNINRWLEYAEKKNTYIFSLFSLMIIFTPFIGRLSSLNSLIKISIGVFYILYVITMIITIISLFPKTIISKDKLSNGKNKKLKESDNLLFYGDIAKYSREEYMDRLEKKYRINICESEYLIHLVDQIIINSNITQDKMNLFKYTSVLTIIALVEFALCFCINLWAFEGIFKC
jgi:hypothetical protein